ncbi:chemotaxis protein CheX [Terriglobus albidus]|uniref:chemotaxis protein CheX n=1 Tax=Terriglobus albidus TaxID=1592106 RepID=UPI0021E06BC7|nr:chemotaxis protein CheX [Terriglobus albidus]
MNVSNTIQDALSALTGCEVQMSQTGSESFPVELHAVVDFNGTPSGMIRLELSQATADRLSATMLGFDDPSEVDDIEMRNDAIGEIVNIIAGKVKALRGKTDALLSMPIVGDIRAERPELAHDNFSGIFMVGEDIVRVSTGWDHPAER